jgi:predicted phosphodiesterase
MPKRQPSGTAVPTVGITVKRYLDQYPDLSKTDLAKRLHTDYPTVFASDENARALIRYYTGAMGVVNLAKVTNSTNNSKSYVSPPSAAKVWHPYIIPPTQWPLAILNDIHFPYHDETALNLAINYMIDKDPKTILLNGDIMDMYSESSYNRDPSEFDSNYEIQMFRAFIRQLQDLFPFAEIIFKKGNHEDRFDNYLMKNGPEVFKIKLFRLNKAIDYDIDGNYDPLNITMLDTMQLVYFRGLTILHGHEYTQSINNPVSPARGLMLRAKKPSICGHFHRKSEQPSNDIRGGQQMSWSIACLCDLHPAYMPLNDWGHGFAVVYGDEDPTSDLFEVNNLAIIKGRIV